MQGTYVLLDLTAADSLLLADAAEVDGTDQSSSDVSACAEDVGDIEAKEATSDLVGGLRVAALDLGVVAADVTGLDLLDDGAVGALVRSVGGSRDGGNKGHEDGRGVHFDGWWFVGKV